MLRSIRLLSIGIILGSVITAARAQHPDAASLPLPENLFPDLKGILENAVKLSPRMVSRNAENAIAEQNYIAARAGQLPSVNAYLAYNPWQRDDRADLSAATDTKKLYYNFNITQPLYHWGALQSNTRIGELQLKVAKGQTADAYRMLVQELRSLYLSVILRRMVVTRTQLNLGIARDQLAVAQSKFEKKVIAEGDLFMPRLNHDQAVLAADRATEDYETAKATLAKLSGAPVLADSQIPAEIPVLAATNDTLAPYLARFTSQKDPRSFYLDSLRDQVEIEKLNYQVAGTRLKPKVNMVVGASQDELSYTTNIAAKYKVQSTYVGVQVNWTIFDGFAARSAVANALTRRRQAEQNYEDSLRNLTEAARSSLKQLGFSARSMELANRVLLSAEGFLHSKEDDVKRGLASEAEVNSARLNYYDSLINAFNSRFDYMMKTGDFLSMMLEDPALANLPGGTP